MPQFEFDFDFDFDHWRSLADEDPAAFFAARERVLQSFMDAAPRRLSAELQALQTLIDHSRAEAGTPVKASQQLLGMLGEHLAALSGHLIQLREQSRALETMFPPSAAE